LFGLIADLIAMNVIDAAVVTMTIDAMYKTNGVWVPEVKSLLPLTAYLAVSVMAEFIVIVSVALFPVYEPVPSPLQLVNVYPDFGVSEMLTDAPWLYHPLDGETVPVPVGETFMVR
jgi:hypothetical protein